MPTQLVSLKSLPDEGQLSLPFRRLSAESSISITPEIGELLIRRRISGLIPVAVNHLTAETVRARYAALLEAKAARNLAF